MPPCNVSEKDWTVRFESAPCSAPLDTPWRQM